MGITGLIPFLEKASSKIHLKEVRGKTVAIDSYCWLHKGVFSCAEKLVRGEDTDQYISYCLKYVQMLLSFDIKPILVFDGMHLPAKALTEKRRRESRRESKKRAAELLRIGKIEEARSHMRRCVDVTHEMALRLIREMRIRNIDCVVAPYEADAQMAWLNKVGIADYIITEDSDLTLFGARKIIFKLDLSANGLLVEADKLYLAMGCSKERYSFEKFRRMCILSGCDYLDSLPGIGLAKACKFMLKTEQEDMTIALKKIPNYLNMKQLQVDDEYIENFMKAEATFKHMYIYNPLERKMERLNDLSEFQTDERYCSNAGTLLESEETALNLALGNLSPFTLKQLDTYHPDHAHGLAEPPPKHIKRTKHKSIWKRTSNDESPKKNTNRRKQTEASCALYFKKVDFISKTIEQDVNESIKEENAKPAESDVFQMYRNEADEPEIKRKRYDSEESECSTTTTSLTSKRHNPFVKNISIEHCGGGGGNESPQKSAVCANSSLLKVLSPKKFQQETERLSSLKRKIFVKEKRIEVRSRFFAENIKLVNESPPTILSNTAESIVNNVVLTDFSDEIKNIERLTQEKAKNQAMLYNSPSPDKPPSRSKAQKIQESLTGSDSGIESLNTAETDMDTQSNTEQSIEISDDDDNVQTKDCTAATITAVYCSKNEIITKNIKCDTSKAQQQQQQTPRIGLSRPKPMKNQRQKPKQASKTEQNQTRLSMFGFQKRSVLK